MLQAHSQDMGLLKQTSNGKWTILAFPMNCHEGHLRTVIEHGQAFNVAFQQPHRIRIVCKCHGKQYALFLVNFHITKQNSTEYKAHIAQLSELHHQHWSYIGKQMEPTSNLALKLTAGRGTPAVRKALQCHNATHSHIQALIILQGLLCKGLAWLSHFIYIEYIEPIVQITATSKVQV